MWFVNLNTYVVSGILIGMVALCAAVPWLTARLNLKAKGQKMIVLLFNVIIPMASIVLFITIPTILSFIEETKSGSASIIGLIMALVMSGVLIFTAPQLVTALSLKGFFEANSKEQS